jgi:hypothetical protein
MHEERNIVENRAAALAARSHEWNELDFVGWNAFRRMAPAVLGLEIPRVERVMATLEPGTDTYNALVHVRHELRRFGSGLSEASKDELEVRSEHLRRALLAVSLVAGSNETLHYVSHRLRYVYDRLHLIY